MPLRVRLIIAFLLLSVVPLSAVTLLSYSSSVRAFERAAEQEATDRAADVSRRMDVLTTDVGRRVDRMFVDASTDASRFGGQVAAALGDTAALVDWVEFHPAAPAPPAPAGTKGVTPPASPGVPLPPKPPAPPSSPVIVMDVQKLMAEVERETRKELVDVEPKLKAIVEQSMLAGCRERSWV
jgi:hypothetical protein